MQEWDAMMVDPDTAGLSKAMTEFRDECRHWRLQPHDDDGFEFLATICPSSGPFRNLSWDVVLEFPTDYPLNRRRRGR